MLVVEQENQAGREMRKGAAVKQKHNITCISSFPRRWLIGQSCVLETSGFSRLDSSDPEAQAQVEQGLWCEVCQVQEVLVYLTQWA
jgi:hypothetical protein